MNDDCMLVALRDGSWVVGMVEDYETVSCPLVLWPFVRIRNAESMMLPLQEMCYGPPSALRGVLRDYVNESSFAMRVQPTAVTFSIKVQKALWLPYLRNLGRVEVT